MVVVVMCYAHTHAPWHTLNTLILFLSLSLTPSPTPYTTVNEGGGGRRLA